MAARSAVGSLAQSCNTNFLVTQANLERRWERLSNFRRIVVTGGAGFVGSNLAIWLKRRYSAAQVFAINNLKRRGSELNLPRLRAANVTFLHGDIRNSKDLQLDSHDIDLIVEFSAESSVLAGFGEAPDYLVNTNLIGSTVSSLRDGAARHSFSFRRAASILSRYSMSSPTGSRRLVSY